MRQRINTSFDEGQHEDVGKYLDWLRAAIADCALSLRRTVAAIILLAVAFELVSESPGVQISLGTFRLYHDSIILQFIPALVAYLYFQTIVDTRQLVMMRQAFGYAFTIWIAKAGKNDLDSLVHSPMPLYWNIAGGVELPSNRPAVRKVEGAVATILMMFISAGSVFFEAQAYYVLVNSSRLNLIPFILSICITFLCFAAALVHGCILLWFEYRQVLLESPEAVKRYPWISRLLEVHTDGNSSRRPSSR